MDEHPNAAVIRSAYEAVAKGDPDFAATEHWHMAADTQANEEFWA